MESDSLAVTDTVLPIGNPPSKDMSPASARYDLFVILAILLLVGGLLGVIWVIYKFMKEDQARWKHVSTEILKHRTQFDQLSNQVRQVMDEQKNADHEWTEEIQRLISGRGRDPQGDATVITASTTASLPVKHSLSSRPTVILEPGTLRLTPMIMTENDMDEVLVNELLELEPSSKIEEVTVDSPLVEEDEHTDSAPTPILSESA